MTLATNSFLRIKPSSKKNILRICGQAVVTSPSQKNLERYSSCLALATTATGWQVGTLD